MQGLCRAGLHTFATEIAGNTIDLDLFIRFDQYYRLLITDLDTAAAAYALISKI
jgi:hypothetical protein